MPNESSLENDNDENQEIPASSNFIFPDEGSFTPSNESDDWGPDQYEYFYSPEEIEEEEELDEEEEEEEEEEYHASVMTSLKTDLEFLNQMTKDIKRTFRKEVLEQLLPSKKTKTPQDSIKELQNELQHIIESTYPEMNNGIEVLQQIKKIKKQMNDFATSIKTFEYALKVSLVNISNSEEFYIDDGINTSTWDINEKTHYTITDWEKGLEWIESLGFTDKIIKVIKQKDLAYIIHTLSDKNKELPDFIKTSTLPNVRLKEVKNTEPFLTDADIPF
jgi:hypothetical protein